MHQGIKENFFANLSKAFCYFVSFQNIDCILDWAVGSQNTALMNTDILCQACAEVIWLV